MNAGIHYAEHFYQQASQDPGMLERNANDYPYSSLAGFLLLYHYKKTNHPGFENLAKKTVLHFKNANWLQFLLDQPPIENAEPLIISPGGSEKGTTEDNEINGSAATGALYDQGPRNDIGQGTENEPLAAEDPEARQEADVSPEILQEQNFQKEFNEDIATSEPPGKEITFEPLHTVDYFASQGIKITGEPLTTDKLGNQMKSFTAWLKSMKKLHPLKPDDQDIALDKLIQNSAEESNINTEVLTEAMAEVLIKQDKKEKAIEMYNKLSLINPSKSVYFAAKIESIKSS